MAYSVKEIYYTIQGEGAQVGRAAVFLRFSGCNLWSGREEDRTTAVCDFCDTDFLGTDGPGGGKFETARELAEAASCKWPRDVFGDRLIVCTGGEPLLQLDAELIEELHAQGFVVAVETNGTLPLPLGIDWICVSPKAGTHLVVTSGDELKLVYPQSGIDPSTFLRMDFRHFFLQPLDGPDALHHRQLVTDYCLEHPQWRVSLQIHKILGLP
jgi:7-carboxy-7-deazaguanine synthase (Cx14CxxC type)